jgi:mannose PTS system EIIA component
MNSEDQDHTPLVRGVVLTHGTMCHGMVDAVRKIAGVDEDALVPVSNDGCGPDELYARVLDAAGPGPAIIFTDLQTGSCALAARFACRDPRNRQIVFGANLPILLDFVFHRELPVDTLVERLLEKGRAAIRTLEPVAASDEPGSASG